MISNDRPIQQLLRWLITTTRGGKTRAQIIKELKKSPQNTNQLATKLKRSYKTIEHHLSVLEKNKLVTAVGDNYATTYFLSTPMEESYVIFQDITSN